MAVGLKAAMKEVGRSASRKSVDGERKERSVKMLACSSADGHMTTAIHWVSWRLLEFMIKLIVFNISSILH